MGVSRRTILKGSGALPLLAGNFAMPVFAQTNSAQTNLAQANSARTNSAASGSSEIPPILFVHGNGDHAALWITTLWRMESNGVPHDRLFAINFTDPLARNDDSV